MSRSLESQGITQKTDLDYWSIDLQALLGDNRLLDLWEVDDTKVPFFKYDDKFLLNSLFGNISNMWL